MTMPRFTFKKEERLVAARSGAALMGSNDFVKFRRGHDTLRMAAPNARERRRMTSIEISF